MSDTYTDEVGAKIIDLLCDGETLRAICRMPGMPKWRTVYDWKRAHPDFDKAFREARKIGFDAIAEDTLEMIDTVPERTPTAFGDKIDAGHIAWQRNRVEQRLKLLAKWDPERFGDKLAIGGAKDLPPLHGLSDDALWQRIVELRKKAEDAKPD